MIKKFVTKEMEIRKDLSINPHYQVTIIYFLGIRVFYSKVRIN